MQIPVTLVYEDELSGACMNKLLGLFGCKYVVYASYNKGGNGYIKKNINAFINASKANPYIVLTDLDKYRCPIDLKSDWIKTPINTNFIFRVAVKEIESWLLSDKEGFAEYFGVSKKYLPIDAEQEEKPKRALIEIVRRSARKAYREDVVPCENARVGPNYNGRLSDFVLSCWNINRAINNNNSLLRAYNNLDRYECDWCRR
jgi:hypothetical protein